METQMTLIRMAAIAAATMLAAATAQAGPLNLPRPQSSPDGQIELIAVHHVYRHHYTPYRHSSGGAFPAAIIGGIVGGALSNGCYFNDCGYGYGYDGGNYGGGYGGGYGGYGRGGYRGGGGFHGGGFHGGGGHAGGFHGGGGGRGGHR
jgi:hypothetical protein